MRKQLRCGTRFERDGWKQGYCWIAGVDEVGIGSLFGPVVAAAVILDPARPIRGLNDSKQLTPEAREDFSEKIRNSALAWAVGMVEAAEIDRINIYQAALLAMKKAVLALSVPPDFLLVDARRLSLDIPQTSIIKGDAQSVSIAAASIVAKVERDAMMCEWDQVYPQYGLASHKGYATPAHTKALRELGPTPLHRISYAPVRNAAGQSQDDPPQYNLPLGG